MAAGQGSTGRARRCLVDRGGRLPWNSSGSLCSTSSRGRSFLPASSVFASTRNSPVRSSTPCVRLRQQNRSAAAVSSVLNQKCAALFHNDCHCEEPAGQRSNLGQIQLRGTRLLRFARNDERGHLYNELLNRDISRLRKNSTILGNLIELLPGMPVLLVS